MMNQSTSFAQVATNLLNVLQGYTRGIRLLLVMFLTLTASTAWAETVTYTVFSTSEVTKSGTAPDGSSATYESTYSTKCQLTKNNSMTLTLSGYDGCTITGLTLSMKSNKDSGTGSMSMKIGSTTSSSIQDSKFNSNNWHGSWSTAYVDVTPSVTATTVGNGEEIVITIAATANSLYCQSFTLTYTPAGGGGDSGDTNCLTLSATSNYPFNSTSSTNTSVYSTTIDGITFENKGGYKYSSYLSFNRSLLGAYIANTTPFSGNIESIVVDYNSGGSSYFDMYEGSASKPSSTVVSPSTTGTGSITYTFSGNNPYFKLALKTTGDYCNINSITICYSNTPPPSHTITATSNNNSYGTVSVSGTTITATPNDGYRVKSGDAGYTVTSGTADVTNNGDNTFSVTPSSDCTITINFEAIPTHKVDFNTGGLVDIESVYVQEGQTYNITQTPASSLTQECEYSTFVGWTKSNTIANPSSKPTIVNSIEMESSDITLYAVYSKTEGGGGSAAEQGTTMFSENWTGCENNDQPTQPTSAGSVVYNAATITYEWKSSGSTSQTYTSGGPNNNANILISKNNGYWKVVGIPTGQAETLTLSSSKSGSGVLSVSTSTSNVSISGSTITIGSSSVNTFDLIFTNTNSSSNLRLDDISVVVAKAGATGSTTYSLTPECTIKTTITLNPNGGTGSMADVTTENGTLTLPKCTFTREGYTFAGWATSADGEVAFADEEVVSNWDADITELFAKWTAKTITITWDANGGSVNPTTSTYTYNGTPVELPIPTRANYTFNGWFTAASEGIQVTEVGTTNKPIEDVTYYAQWTSNKTATSLIWSAATYSATIDVDNDFPTLTVEPEAIKESVQYNSSDKTIATIDANGNITLLKKGETTITATFEETATHTSATASYTLTVHPSNCKWVETNTIEDGDEVVITSQIGGVVYALPNTYGTSTPAVMIVNNIKNNEIPSVSNDIKWTIEKQGEQYIFHPNGDLNSWLYCTNNNDGVRVGTNANKTFAIGQNLESITHVATNRSIRIGTTDLGQYVWRCYTTTSDQTLKLYKRECLDASKVWVEGNLTNVTCTQTLPQQIAKSETLALNFEAATGYALPDNVTVTGATPSWNKATGTLTISNPTANVTITIEALKLHTINWMVGSSSVLTEEVANGTGVTQTPASNPESDAIGDCADTFLGWSEKSAGSTPQDAAYYDDLCSAAQMKAKHTSVTGDKIFYAVFATEEGSATDFKRVTSLDELSDGISIVIASTKSSKFMTYSTAFGSSDWSESNGKITATDNMIFTLVAKGDTWRIQKGTNIVSYEGRATSNPYCKPLLMNSNIKDWILVKNTSTTNTFTFYYEDGDYDYAIEYYSNESNWYAYSNRNPMSNDYYALALYVPDVTYSNYVTNCCALAPATNLTVSGTTVNSATLTWTAPSPTTGITKLQVRNAETDEVVVDDIAVGTTTATITGLTECTKYNYYVASVGDCEVFSNTVTAQPFSNAKTVNYDYNGGSGSPASFTTSCENQVITLPTATRAGYDFNGWYTAATGGTKVGDAGGTYDPTISSITLYAQWTKQIYSISFDANGGSGTMANQQADENDKIAQLNANQFTRTGYVFVGWNTSTSGTGTAYIDQQTNITLTQNLTLYAQWAPVVTLNDAGNEETAHPTAVNGTITLPAGANACDPYEFVGWTSVAIADWNGEIEEPELVTSPYKPTAPITLYAVYKIQDEGNPNAFKLSFEGGNGKTYYVGSYNSSPYLRGYSNITEEEAVTFIRTKMYPNDDTRYYLHMEHTGEYLYYTGSLNSTSSTPSESQGWVFHTVGDKIKLQSTYSYDPDYLSFSDRDQETINISTSTSGSEFNMLSAVTSTYVAAPLCNQEITITFETGNGDFVANAPATNPLTVSRGDVITLPTCEYPGYEFMGWMKDEQQLDPSDIIGTYYTGDYTVDGVSSTITFYAYYKAIPEEVEFSGKDDVELLMYYYDGTANYYYASSLDGGNGELPSMQNCFNATTWTFTNVGNMQYHIQDETGKYLGAVNDNDNDLSLSNTPKVWNFTLVNGLWKMVCEDSPSRALMYISTGKKFANAAISNEGNGAYSYVTLGICPYPTYTTNPVLSQGFSITNTAMVTSASGQKVKATSALTLETRNIELPCTFTIAAPNITFYDNTGAEVNQLTASAASEQFELHFAYQPTAENTMEYPTVTITDDEMKTYTIKNRISARSLPAVFVIAAKTGNSWVALNANITSTGTQAAPLIMVDNIALPTKATITPNTTKYQLLGLQTDKPSNANSRFKNNGAAIHLYSTNVSKVISASTSTDNKKTYINADAAHDDAASSSNCLFYEWQLQTNDLVHYTLVNSNTTNTSNTKLGYSATYAQWGMYQTGNNVIQEVLLLPIEKDITEMDVEVMEWGTNSMALRFGSEAPATVDITLGATTTKGLSLVNLNSGNTSDIYKVEGLSLAGNDCEALLITDATDASKGKLIRKPILVSGDKNGSDYTIAPTRDVCMHSDIVILNGGRLTANEANSPGSHVDFANIYVYPGGKLVLDEKSLGVKQQVYLRGGYSWLNQSTYALPEVYLNGDINFNGSGNMIYDYYIQNQKYYQFALPYDVQLAKVTDESGADDFPVWVKHYNGALRAADAYATSWEWYPSEEGDAKAYFKEGEGYIIAAKPRQVGNVANRPLSIIRFPLGNKAFNSTNGIETDLTITTTAHGIDGYKAGTITANNVGWNFVGNPFMATWKGDIGHKELAKHPDENNWDGSYHWVDSDVKYITIMSPEDGSDYAQYIASNTELKPFFPFYIQETADGGGTINFAAANRVKKAPVLWNVEQDEREAYIQIEIAMDAVADQTGVFVSNKYSDEIDFDDYGKMFGSSTDKPKVWLVHDNTRLAFEAMTENRATGMTPLGYRAPQDGKYMLVLNDEVSQLNNVESIYLTDYKTGVTDYDLTLSTYEFESTTTLYNDTRFAIRVVMRDNTQGPITGVENVNTDNGQIHKFIYQGKIYILHHGVIYDATGKRVITINK